MTTSSTNDNDGLLANSGGSATAAGILFQQKLGALIGGWMLAGNSLDQRLNLGTAQPLWFRFETEAPVDDILIGTSDSGFVAVQAKTSLSLSRNLQSQFGKTVEQFVRHWLVCRDGDGKLDWNRPLDLTTDRLVLAVGPQASAKIRVDLPAALRKRREPGESLMSDVQRKALNDFEYCVREVWPTLTSEPFIEQVLAELSHLVVIYTFDPDDSLLQNTLQSVLPNAESASAARLMLGHICGEFMARRGGASSSDLREAIIKSGAKLEYSPPYRADIAKLRDHSTRVGKALHQYEIISVGPTEQIAIRRECQDIVEAAAQNGSFLIVGEPGAGKSGVLNALASSLKYQGFDVLELAVDSYSIESLEGLTRELDLAHPLLDVIDAWDGSQPAWLIIDALDATRGGKGEAVYRALIESVMRKNGRWKVVASIRTFDLRMGQQLRSLFKGQPLSSKFAEPALSNIRHICIPPWSETELERLLANNSPLNALLTGNPGRLHDLARVPFNTRLLGEIVSSGVSTANVLHVSTQTQLLSLYWELRIERHGFAAEKCLHRLVQSMVNSHSLRVSRASAIDSDPETLEVLHREGVLISVDADRWVQFRHHILFDYAASRVYFDSDNHIQQNATAEGSKTLGLMLAPAFSFILKELWASETNHFRFWKRVVEILGDQAGDPVIRSATSRISVELPEQRIDTESLAEIILAGGEAERIAFSQVIGALAVRIEDEGDFPLSPWSHLAALVTPGVVLNAWTIRSLGFLLIDRAKETVQHSEMGETARALLQHAFTVQNPVMLSTAAIEFVISTYETDPDQSRMLLGRVFDHNRFKTWGFEEAPAIARKIAALSEVDPEFAAIVYREIYTKKITEDRETLLGASQILPLRSNARQDYEMARYSLSEHFPKFLESDPLVATKAFLWSVNAYVDRAHHLESTHELHQVDVNGRVAKMQEDLSYIWAHNPDDDHGQDAEVLITKFVSHLKAVPESHAIILADYLISNATLAVYWSRLFMVGAKRNDELTDFLWPYAASEAFLVSPDTRKDAIDLLVCGIVRRSESERQQFEKAVFEFDLSRFVHAEDAKRYLLIRLFSAIGKGYLLTKGAQQFLETQVDEEVENERLHVVKTSAHATPPYFWIDGLDHEAPENAIIIEKIESLTKKLNLRKADESQVSFTLDEALRVLRNLVSRLDATKNVHEKLRGYAEGILGEGIQKILEAKLLSAETSETAVTELVHFIQIASNSQNPYVDSMTDVSFEESPSWGSPAARVEAATAALELLFQRPDLYAALAPLIDKSLADRHPAVRMQACHRLVRLWHIDRFGMWTRIERRLATETSIAVLVLLISAVISKYLHTERARIELLLLNLLDRFENNEDATRRLSANVASLLSILWVTHELPKAHARINAWISNAENNFDPVRSVLTTLRGALVFGLKQGDPGDLPIRQRAQKIYLDCIQSANKQLAEFYDTTNPTAENVSQAKQCVEVIDIACRELYFAAGISRQQDDENAKLQRDDLQQYFNEVHELIDAITEYGSPHTIYYLLQLLEQLIKCNPGKTFDLAAGALLKGGKRGGYQYESMGADLIVKIFGVFLADHKDIFEESKRRELLVASLEILMNAGWSSARRLLYRIPDLLQ
ncbi:MAG: hypothetical protein ACREPB_07840 [Arenimonas sp.]